jgi:hypothetical protein
MEGGMKRTAAGLGIAFFLLGVVISVAGAGVPRVIVGEEFGATW